MKNMYKFCAGVFMAIAVINGSYAQKHDGEKINVGNCKQLLQTAKNQPTGLQKGSSTFNLPISSSSSLKAKVNFKKTEGISQEYIIGEISSVPGSDFHLRVNENSVEGTIVLRDQKQAYKYSSDAAGNAYVQEVDINDVICVEYDHSSSKSSVSTPAPEVMALNPAVANLQSFPGANGCVLLDFDGQYVSGTPWNGGNPINAAPSGMSDAAIQECWEVVAEDFRPFHINITTNEAVFNSYPKNRRMRCIITPTNTAAPGAGGVAYIGSFAWNDDTPCWVFITSGKSGGEASSHEVGHTLDLGHDGRTSPSEGYYRGHGDWAPIMGVGYYEPISQWSKGEYANANNKEDDLAKITGTKFGLGYRVDDHGNATSNATALKMDASGNVAAAQNFGIIERTSDLDFFSFNTGGGTVTLNFNPASRHGDLDILVRLYNSSGAQIATSNPAGLAANLNVSVGAGTYYVSIDGTGAGDPLTNGYSDYASLGYFSISGKVPVGGGNQLPSVSITGPTNGQTFNAPANVTISANASDADGTISRVEFFNGSTKIGEDVTAPYSIAWNSLAAGSYTITARATDNAGGQRTSAAVTFTVVTVQNGVATVYKHCEFNTAGYAIVLPVGDYTTAQLVSRGILNNDISSLRVNSGYEILLYDLDNFQGTPRVFTAQDNCLVDNGINDWASSVRVRAVNRAPSVAITAPGSGASFNAPANVNIAANASDGDGTISKVEFFNGSAKLGEDLTSPYAFAWNNLSAGSYSITAVATDNAGARTTSSVVTFNVVAVTYVATIYKHCNYSVDGYAIQLPVGDYTTAQLTARGILDNDASSLKVTSGYEIVLYQSDNFTGASLIFRADDPCLVDNGVNDWASSIRVRTVTNPNQVPTAAISSPATGASFNAPANIAISANAGDADGTVTKVEFFSGALKLGEDLTAPYTFTYSNVAAGSYTLTVKATDNSGAVTTSAVVNVTVNNVSTDACSTVAQYVENGGYVAGSEVKNQGNKYTCKPWPYSGWCNGSSWAYAPGTGAYWTDAWTLSGACSSNASAAAITTSFAVTNPVRNEMNVHFDNSVIANGDIQIVDAFGKEVMKKSGVTSGETIDMSSLSDGMYLVIFKYGSEVITKKVIKQ